MWLLSNLCVSVFVCIIISVAAENNCTIPIEEDDHGQNLVHHAHVRESTNEVDYALPFRINVTTCNFTLNFENGTELSKNQYSLETITTHGGNERDHLFFKKILQGKFRLKFSDGTEEHLYFFCQHEVCQDSFKHFEQRASVSKTIFNYYPKTVSFKLDQYDADFQKCFQEHGCYVEDPYGSTECDVETKTLKFRKTLVEHFNVTLRCHEDVPWSLKIKIDMKDYSLATIIVFCK